MRHNAWTRRLTALCALMLLLLAAPAAPAEESPLGERLAGLDASELTELRELIDLRLRALGDGDKFLDTYYCFLANNCKMSATAQKLDIHLSTLKYRMEKINGTVSLDPEDYRGRMAFLLSYDLQKEAALRQKQTFKTD